MAFWRWTTSEAIAEGEDRRSGIQGSLTGRQQQTDLGYITLVGIR